MPNPLLGNERIARGERLITQGEADPLTLVSQPSTVQTRERTGAAAIVEKFRDPEFRLRFTNDLNREEQYGLEQEALGYIMTDPLFSQAMARDPDATMQSMNEFARTLPVPLGPTGIQAPPSAEALQAPHEGKEGLIGFASNFVDPGVLLDPETIALGVGAGAVSAAQVGKGIVGGGVKGALETVAFPATATVLGVVGIRNLMQRLARKPLVAAVTEAPKAPVAVTPEPTPAVQAAKLVEPAQPLDPAMVPRSELTPEQNAEVYARALKGEADLEIAGLERGTKVFLEQEGKGSTPEVIGLKSPTADWYKQATTGPGRLSRERVEAAIQKILADKGRDKGQDVLRVKQLLFEDREFMGTPFAPKSEEEWASLIQEAIETTGKPPIAAVPIKEPLAVPRNVEKDNLAASIVQQDLPDGMPLATKAALGDDLATDFLGTFTEPQLRTADSKIVTNAALELFKTKQLTWDPKMPPSMQILEALRDGRLTIQELSERGINMNQLASLYEPAKTYAGRVLNHLSRISRTMNALAERDPKLRAELAELAESVDEHAAGRSLWRRLDNIRRGLLVTQLSTAMRNFETQMGRVGLDVLQAPLDAALAKVSGVPTNVHPLDGVETMLNVFRRGTKEEVDTILKAFPKEQERLFLRYSSDISKAADAAGLPISKGQKMLGQAEKAVDLLNVFNRFQEFVTRRGVFQATLDQRLRGKNLNLQEMISRNEVGAIPEEDIKAAVTKALEVTFAEQPAWGTLGQKFVSFVNSMPGATFAIPFPRFMVNSLKFLFDYNPTGLLPLLKESERKALANGDMSKLSKPILGSAMLFTAWQIRNSDAAQGTKWHELKTPDGKVVNLLPFNPFASYLFIADLIKRQKDGTLFELAGKDIALGVLASNLRAGTGLFILDQFLEGLTSLDSDVAAKRLKEFAGEVIGGLATPLGTIKDLVDQFENNPQVQRDRKEEPLLGPLKTRIPGMEETLPEQPSPLRTEPSERLAPALKQLTGVAMRSPQTLVEDEVNRLQIPFRRLFPRSPVPEFDRELAATMGPKVQATLTPLLASGAWQNLKPEVQRVILIKTIAEIRNVSRKTVLERLGKSKPELVQQLKIEEIDRDLMRILEGAGVEKESLMAPAEAP